MILSNVASVGVEEVTAACGEPVWMQLYATARWDVAHAVMRRAEAAGSRVIVLTVDPPTYSNRLTLLRGMRADSRDCTACHRGSPGRDQHLKPMYAGTGLGADEFRASGLTWEFLQRMRDSTHMRIVVKGIVTREDAARCLAAGVDGIIVSNHGGRSDDTGRAAIDSLPEVVAVAGGKVPVLVDSGFRRGTDVLKALALGASAVNIGRPYAWGLAAFGESGVARAMEIIRTELETNMRLVGAPSIADISPDLVAHA
jgi:isopentenyl diphosphate isomerase/L-lactate dehydrogenase-like FMN-dependent dehydrogenase